MTYEELKAWGIGAHGVLPGGKIRFRLDDMPCSRGTCIEFFFEDDVSIAERLELVGKIWPEMAAHLNDAECKHPYFVRILMD